MITRNACGDKGELQEFEAQADGSEFGDGWGPDYHGPDGLESKMPASDPFGCAQGKKRALQLQGRWRDGYGLARVTETHAEAYATWTWA